MSDALKFENVGKNFRNFNALDDVTFSVKKGQFHAFIGSNGADDAPDLHHDTMTIDDEAFKVSVPYYVESALCLLKCYK